MADVSAHVMMGQLKAVLREAFDGPEGNGSYFTDHGSEAGLFGTLARLDAAGASRILGGTSIAAHAYHLIFGLEASSAWIRGDRIPRNWKESWSISAMDGPRWSRALGELRAGYADLCSAIDAKALSDADAIGGAIAVLAHVAYHLGAIRQKAAFLRDGAS